MRPRSGALTNFRRQHARAPRAPPRCPLFAPYTTSVPATPTTAPDSPLCHAPPATIFAHSPRRAMAAAMASARLRALVRVDADEPAAVADLLRVWHREPDSLLRQWQPFDFVELLPAASTSRPHPARADIERRIKRWIGTTVLHLAAAASGSGARALHEALRLLRHAPSSPNAPDPLMLDVRDMSGLTPLSYAVRADSAGRIHALVLAGADPSAQYAVAPRTRRLSPSGPSRHHQSLLRFAAATGRVAALAALLSQAADHVVTGPDGKRPLHLAIERGRLACVQLLLTADLAAIDGFSDPRRRRALALDRFIVKNSVPRLTDAVSERVAAITEGVAADATPEVSAFQSALTATTSTVPADEDAEWEQVTDDADSDVFVEVMVEDMETGVDHTAITQRRRSISDTSANSDGTAAFIHHLDSAFDTSAADANNNIDGTEGLSRIFRQALQQVEITIADVVVGSDPVGATVSLNPNRDRGSSLYHLAASYNQPRVLQCLLMHDNLCGCHPKDIRNEQGKVAIFMAARSGSISCLELLLQHGASINAVDLENWTILNEAVKYSRIDTVNYILQHGGNVALADDDAWTPLHVAGRFGIVEAVAPLVAAGGNINAVTEDFETPLLLACSQTGHETVVRELLKHGATHHVDGGSTLSPLKLIADRKDFPMLDAYLGFVSNMAPELRPDLDFESFGQNGEHLIFTCIKANAPEIIKHVLKLGVNPNIRNSDGDTPLCAAVRADKVDAVSALLQGGADPDFSQENGSRAVHIASDEGHSDLIRLIAAHDGDLEEPVPSPALHEGFTPLMLATRRGHTGCVKVLVDSGVSLNTAKRDMYTAVHLAALNGQVDALRVLLDAGANRSPREENSFAPLHVAVRNNQLDAVRVLLSGGVNADARGPSGLTALHFAAYMSNARMIWLLLAAGADADATDADGSRALHVAAGRERGRVAVQMLLTQGASIDARDGQGDVPLHSAAYRGLYAIVKVLLRRGADVNVRNDLGLTPLHLAAAKGSENTVRVLMRSGAPAGARAEDGTTAYQLATRAGHVQARIALWQACGQSIDTVAPVARYSVRSPVQSPAASMDIVINGERGRTRCVVCQSALRFQEEIRELPCSHVYHDACIMQWFGGGGLGDHHTCPLCQTTVLPDDFDAGDADVNAGRYGMVRDRERLR